MSNVLMVLSGLGIWNNCYPGHVTTEWRALAKIWCGNVEGVAVGHTPIWTSPGRGYDATKEILMVLGEVLEEQLEKKLGF